MVLRRLHNPHGHECGCDADCWCQRTAVGRAVKRWFPARYFGLRHKNHALEQWKLVHPTEIPRSGSAFSTRAKAPAKIAADVRRLALQCLRVVPIVVLTQRDPSEPS